MLLFALPTAVIRDRDRSLYAVSPPGITPYPVYALFSSPQEITPRTVYVFFSPQEIKPCWVNALFLLTLGNKSLSGEYFPHSPRKYPRTVGVLLCKDLSLKILASKGYAGVKVD